MILDSFALILFVSGCVSAIIGLVILLMCFVKKDFGPAIFASLLLIVALTCFYFSYRLAGF